jgi:oxygen-independent coproporphyrinogen-3 oxidase
MELKPDAKESRFHLETLEGPAGIYAHIPFCLSKCPYCSFVSYQGMNLSVKNDYMQALKLQAHAMACHPWSRARTFHSLFIGGGTPSSVDTEKMAAFIEACLESYDFTAAPGKKPEVTLEANPNSLNSDRLDRFKQAGVNRLSIGIQSFSDAMLRQKTYGPGGGKSL